MSSFATQASTTPSVRVYVNVCRSIAWSCCPTVQNKRGHQKQSAASRKSVYLLEPLPGPTVHHFTSDSFSWWTCPSFLTLEWVA